MIVDKVRVDQGTGGSKGKAAGEKSGAGRGTIRVASG